MLALARERYQHWAWDRRDAVAALAFPGTWKRLARFPRAGLREFAYASSRQAYLTAARKYCPDLCLADLAEYSCGIRAQAVTRGRPHDPRFRLAADCPQRPRMHCAVAGGNSSISDRRSDYRPHQTMSAAAITAPSAASSRKISRTQASTILATPRGAQNFSQENHHE